MLNEITKDIEDFLNRMASLNGKKIPSTVSGIESPYAPAQRWELIEEGKVYLSINEKGYPYLLTRIKILPRFKGTRERKPMDRIAWAALRMNIDDKTLKAKNPKDNASILEKSNGFWKISEDFWLAASPTYLGELFELPFNYMNWKGNPLP